MTIHINSLKKSCVDGAALGALSAIPALIPHVMYIIALFLLPFLSAPAILLLLQVRENSENLCSLEVKDYTMLGAIIGAVSCFSFLIIFSPLVILIHIFIKNYYTYAINILNPFLAIVFLVTIALIFALTNAGSGLITGLLVKQFRKN